MVNIFFLLGKFHLIILYLCFNVICISCLYFPYILNNLHLEGLWKCTLCSEKSSPSPSSGGATEEVLDF